MNVLTSITVLGFLIFFHEMGHFLAAILQGIYVDGFSIGSNDLTQLTLGLDRDSHLVSHIYNERNPAVKKMLEMVITTAKKNNVKIY